MAFYGNVMKNNILIVVLVSFLANIMTMPAMEKTSLPRCMNYIEQLNQEIYNELWRPDGLVDILENIDRMRRRMVIYPQIDVSFALQAIYEIPRNNFLAENAQKRINSLKRLVDLLVIIAESMQEIPGTPINPVYEQAHYTIIKILPKLRTFYTIVLKAYGLPSLE
jgi:hypothetical protein